jgi:hypothetical protein
LPEKTRVERKEGELPELPNAEKGKLVLRHAPFPSGAIHIGNAIPLVINDEYRKMYDGKVFLVIDDTIGSEEKQITPESYDMIPEDMKALGMKWDDDCYSFYFDDELYCSAGTKDSVAVSNVPEYIILSSEVEDNNWAGRIPAEGYGTLSENKTKMTVDWVRVYKIK